MLIPVFVSLALSMLVLFLVLTLCRDVPRPYAGFGSVLGAFLECRLPLDDTGRGFGTLGGPGDKVINELKLKVQVWAK